MIRKITRTTLACLANSALREYAERYVTIEEGFREAVAEFGVPFAEEGCGEDCETSKREVVVAEMAEQGLALLNDGKSLLVGWQSSACEACRLGLHTETFVLTLECPRRCFFCFNPNQEDFDGRAKGSRDVQAQLKARAAQGVNLHHVALTGGEPLLYPDDTVAFIELARELFPGVHTRLYTSGWGVDAALLVRLRDAGLSEIRFSLKTDDPRAALDKVFVAIEQAVAYIPDVMVEMPVMPGEGALMRDVLRRLDAAGVRGINLLELGFPLFNGEAFATRGYKLKYEPYRVLYDYAYAAGLPVAGSEETCLSLLRFALEENLSLGVHYCSMENKHTGQVFQQNRLYADAYPLHIMSKRDHFLKSAKVFGDDREAVRRELAAAGEPFEDSEDFDFTEFRTSAIPGLRAVLPHTEVAVSFAICEPRDGEVVLRELALFATTPATFNETADV